jgi:hypothetical protein
MLLFMLFSRCNGSRVGGRRTSESRCSNDNTAGSSNEKGGDIEIKAQTNRREETADSGRPHIELPSKSGSKLEIMFPRTDHSSREHGGGYRVESDRGICSV